METTFGLFGIAAMTMTLASCAVGSSSGDPPSSHSFGGSGALGGTEQHPVLTGGGGAPQGGAAGGGALGGDAGQATGGTSAGGTGVSVSHCAAGEVLCAGTCVDLATDPQHCGACGHGCCDGPCVSGSCKPVTIAAGEQWPWGIAVDDKTVYWSNMTTAPNGAVRRVAKDGTGLGTVLGGLEMPSVMTADEARIYVASANGHAVVSVTKEGSAPTTLTGNEAAINDLRVDESSVYWTFGEPGWGKVKKMPKNGAGSPVELAANQNTPMGLALDATHVYFATWNGETVMKVPKGGGALEQLWFGGNANGAGPQYLVVDSTNVYFSDVKGGGGVRKVGIDGSNAVVAAWPTTNQVWNSFSVAADATSVYFTNPSEDSIRKIDKDTGAVSVVASDINPEGVGPWSIAVDQSCVYWTNSGYTGTVMKTGK